VEYWSSFSAFSIISSAAGILRLPFSTLFCAALVNFISFSPIAAAPKRAARAFNQTASGGRDRAARASDQQLLLYADPRLQLRQPCARRMAAAHHSWVVAQQYSNRRTAEKNATLPSKRGPVQLFPCAGILENPVCRTSGRKWAAGSVFRTAPRRLNPCRSSCADLSK
jgi:hypothetical protein